MLVVFVVDLVFEVDLEPRFRPREVDWLEAIAWLRDLIGFEQPLRSERSGPPCLANSFMPVKCLGAQWQRKSVVDSIYWWLLLNSAKMRRVRGRLGRRYNKWDGFEAGWVFLRSISLKARLVNGAFDKLSQNAAGDGDLLLG